MSDHTPVTPNPWGGLRRHTKARIALGRAGVSLPTRAHLEFQLAHARARDAVHLPLNSAELRSRLEAHGHTVIQAHSQAPDRTLYLQRPDLGRRLDLASRQRVHKATADYDAALVIADGLSAFAVHENAVAMVQAIAGRLKAAGWFLAPVVVVEQGRVAIGDEIGERLGASQVAVLIGERPGLSSPDSLGIYLTYDPKPGRVDAQRNCLSNIRREGQSVDAAAHTLYYLMSEARRRRLSGVQLKDDAPEPGPALTGPAGRSFLLED